MVTKSKSATTNGHVGKNRIKDVGPKLEVSIQPLNVQQLSLKIVGISPLMTQPMPEKARKEMLDKQSGKTKSVARAPRCPEQEFLDSLYWVKGSPPKPKTVDGMPVFDPKIVAKALKEGVFGLPLAGFKNAIVSACRNCNINMTIVRQCISVRGKHPTYAIINGSPIMDNRIVRIGRKIPQERFRALFEPWSTEIIVDFDRNVLSPEEVVNLVNVAGFYVGVCEARPEKCAIGFGRFSVGTA